jgi:MSHA biogenesis protein MshJ
LAPVYKHGLTLTLKGSYFDVLDYLHAVEESPWHFFWERLEYRVGHYPEAEVTLRVYTLGDHEELIGA